MRTLVYEPSQLDRFYLERIEDTNRRLRLSLSFDRRYFLATCLADGHLCYNRYGAHPSFVYCNAKNYYIDPVCPVAEAIGEVVGFEDSLDLRTYHQFTLGDPHFPAYPFCLYEGTLGSIQSRFEAFIETPYGYETFIERNEPRRLQIASAAFVMCMLVVNTLGSIKLRRAIISTYGWLDFLEKTDVAGLEEEMELVDEGIFKYGSFDGWRFTSMDNQYAYYEPDKFKPGSASASKAYHKLRSMIVLWNDGSLLADRLIHETLPLALS